LLAELAAVKLSLYPSPFAPGSSGDHAALAKIITAWPTLSEAIRRAMLALVG
jgi:hypothetical protein